MPWLLLVLIGCAVWLFVSLTTREQRSRWWWSGVTVLVLGGALAWAWDLATWAIRKL